MMPSPTPAQQSPITILVLPLDDDTVLSQPITRNPSAPVTISWAGQSSAVTGGALPDAPPPDYSQARAPTRVLTYTFSPHGQGTVLLVPPPDAPDSRPLYHISASLNVFNPWTGTTTIRRAGSADGTVVREFRWGTSKADFTIIADGAQHKVASCLQRGRYGRKEHVWTCTGQLSRRLYWNAEEDAEKCYLMPADDTPWLPTPGRDKPLAGFTAPPLGGSHPPGTLIVHPRAHEDHLLDDIALVALLLQNLRYVQGGKS